ncbi:ABC-2 type transport system permease protein [Murinocardiopsis flavida]|uniref:ABC-2 type transport system permease protein n=1 Tax=Murinocardiopsis flavida TaxID=645275 RepID=A0A2P8D6X7_9ACTN|nr:ABC transporter permease [Murinocardiopsis flavida]PSK92947.1 ABC-2 type transport system permease protein [Murinocardiopsis flavida]
MAHWLRSYALLLKWNVLGLRLMLPFFVAVQVVLSVGIVVGFSFLVPDLDRTAALYLSTGAPTVNLVLVGMVLTPNGISTKKQTGAFDHQRALPVPRLALLAADTTLWIAAAVPGVVAGLGVAVLRFDISLTIGWTAVPALLLVALTCTTLGYALAYTATPMVTALVAQMVVFFTLMFSPINFPADRLPEWFQAVHAVLPFAPMAQAVRESLAVPPGGPAVLPFAVLAAYCALGFAVSYAAMLRRP